MYPHNFFLQDTRRYLVDSKCQYATLEGGAKVADGEKGVEFLTIFCGNIKVCRFPSSVSRTGKNNYLPREKYYEYILFFFNNTNEGGHSN